MIPKFIFDLLQAWSTDEGRAGIVATLLFMLTISVGLGLFSEINTKSIITTDNGAYWFSTQDTSKPVLSFPNTNNPTYTVYLNGVTPEGGGVYLKISEANGAVYEGTFFKGDVLPINDWRVEVTDIQLDRPEPVLLTYYKIWNLTEALRWLFVLIVIKLFWDGIKKEPPKKEVRFSKPDECE